MGITTFIATITAIVGVILGIISILREFNKDKVRLKVIPIFEEKLCLRIDVINISNFPIFVSEVGLIFNRTKKKYSVTFLEGKIINSREKVRVTSINYGHEIKKYDLKKIKCVYAKTDCGVVCYNFNESLKELKKHGFKKENKGD